VDALGLNLRFQVQPDGSVIGRIRSRESLRSYADTVHGGILTAMLDAAMTHVLFSIGVVAVTAELKIRFLAPVAPDRDLVLRAMIERDDHPLFHVRAELEQEQELRTRALGRFLARADLQEDHVGRS
jgi:acyl-coenzyme A thioesterase PaaI-like protein